MADEIARTERFERAVVVDDHNSMRKILRRILESLDFTVVEFSGGFDAIEHLKRNPVDLIVSDIFMPRGSGNDLVQFVRARSMANDLPIIFVTGEAGKQDIVASVEHGVTDYMLKPFETEEFSNKIRSVVERYKHPSEKDRLTRLAERLYLSEKFEESRSTYMELFQSPEMRTPRILVGLAQAEAKLGNIKGAMELLTASSKENPLYHHAYATAADMMLDQGMTDQAMAFMRKELDIHGKQPLRRLKLADLFFKQERKEECLEQLRLALLDSPRNEEVLLRLGEIHFQLGNIDKSVHYYLKTRRQNPDSSRALDGLLKVYTETKQPRKAVNLFTDFIKINPHQKDLFLARAKAHAHLEEWAGALSDVESYLSLDKTTVAGLEFKARILNKLGKLSEAADVRELILSLKVTPENYAKLGLLRLKACEFKHAVDCYLKALELEPRNPKFHFNLAFALESLGDLKNAQKSYNNVCQIVPDHKEALEARTRIQLIFEKQALSAKLVTQGDSSQTPPEEGLESAVKRRRLVS
jgi:DNA-binding response OmpR family regulator/Flp pilus assembly protein TadD